jgi:hypothetical protein
MINWEKIAPNTKTLKMYSTSNNSSYTFSLMQYIYIYLAFILTYFIFYYFASELEPCSLQSTKEHFNPKLDVCMIFRYVYQ